MSNPTRKQSVAENARRYVDRAQEIERQYAGRGFTDDEYETAVREVTEVFERFSKLGATPAE